MQLLKRLRQGAPPPQQQQENGQQQQANGGPPDGSAPEVAAAEAAPAPPPPPASAPAKPVPTALLDQFSPFQSSVPPVSTNNNSAGAARAAQSPGAQARQGGALSPRWGPPLAPQMSRRSLEVLRAQPTPPPEALNGVQWHFGDPHAKYRFFK